MEFEIRPLGQGDTAIASNLDREWFGTNGITAEELDLYLRQYPSKNIAIFRDGNLHGFATFEILEKAMPKEYVGNIKYGGKVMFIHQFTTTTNYKKDDWSADDKLVEVVEQRARELGCKEVWEALSINHPYSKEYNADFDVFGFYELHGYFSDRSHPFVWQPSNTVSIPCLLFRKDIQA